MVSASRKPRRGVSAVEFAVILPLLVLIVLGCVDFGRFVYSFLVVTNAARAGAGYGIVHPPFEPDGTLDPTKKYGAWQSRVVDEVEKEMWDDMWKKTLDGFNRDDVTATVTITGTGTGTPGPGDWEVTVEVPYRFQMIVLSWKQLPTQINMTGRAIMPGIR